MTFSVKCWHCGKVVSVEGDSPQMAVDLMNAADVAGMRAYLDHYRNRVLVFCNDGCAKEETTKAGAFRLRPKGVSR